MSTFPLGRIGYWWSEKKSRKFNVQEFSNVCRTYGFELLKIDLNNSLEEQGPFVAIVHKITDIILKAEKGDEHAKIICEAFQKYIDDHPEIVLIDSLPNIKKLTNRNVQYKCVVNDLSKKADVFIPTFVELTTTNMSENISKLKTSGVDFPIVCKPTVAHGSTAHQMCIIFNEEGLKDVTPPCVAQKFVNHNAVLFKLFTIGDKYFMIERPSLKNFSAGDQKTIFFNSHEISKPNSASELNELDDNDEQQRTPYVLPEKEKMDYIVETLLKCLGLNLLGIDFIIDNKTGHYGVVDINVFPGYDEVDCFFQLLCELIIKKMSLRAAGKEETDCKPSLNFILTPRGHQKFSFDSVTCDEGRSENAIQNAPSCFCCPISSVCLNGLHTAKKHSKINHLAETRLGLPHFHSVDCAQDDSGIETSDSCDEKKDLCHRTLRRLHSRINSVNSAAAVAVDGSS